MKTRKIILAIAAISAAAAMLAACGNKNNTPETTAPATEATTSAAPETTTEALPEIPEDEAGAEDALPEDEGGEGINVQFAEGENSLRPLVEAAVSAGEWPALWEMNDPDFIKDFFGIDVTDSAIEEAIFMQCPMSANMTELHIIKASDVKAAKEMLEARKTKAQTQDAFYPEDVEKAGSSIVGTEGSYAYFIMAADSSAAEDALVKAIKAL